ncbi:MAG: Ig-like domain-containing protein [Lachnospiraceae bacterium]|nr:Ig-like domain-containing protein [Lachnospiraceae bacterium]
MKKFAQKSLCLLTAAAVIAGGVHVPSVANAEESLGTNGLVAEWFVEPEASSQDRGNAATRWTQLDENKKVTNTFDRAFDGLDTKQFYRNYLGKDEYVSERYSGRLYVETEGDYTFYGWGDDGFVITVDNNKVIDYWVTDWEKEQTSQAIHLTAGMHDIVISHLQGFGGASLRVSWESSDAGVAKSVIPASNYYLPDNAAAKVFLQTFKGAYTNANGVLEAFKDSYATDLVQLAAAVTEAKSIIDNFDTLPGTAAEIRATMETSMKKMAAAQKDFFVATGVQSSTVADGFYNPLYQGQDPFIAQYDGFYYLVASSNSDDDSKVYISKSRTLTDQGEKVTIMDFTKTPESQRRIFAPEIFHYGNHWYIYYCADVWVNGDKSFRYYTKLNEQGITTNNNHIACCLKSKTDDPMGEWEDMGPMMCGADNVIYGANDITTFEYDGHIYALWGTLDDPASEAGQRGPAIVELDPEDPSNVIKDNGVYRNRSRLNAGEGEGPRALFNPDGRLYFTSSVGDYQSDGYRLGLFIFNGNKAEDLFDPSKWEFKDNVFNSTANVSGPARASFVKSADGTEDWMVFHSRVFKENNRNTWRQVNIKKFTWNEDGSPNFGAPVSVNKYNELPSGDPGIGDLYQAENALIAGNCRVDNDAFNFLGDGYVHVDNKPGASINFVVNADEAGDYLVGLSYAYGERKDKETTENINNGNSQLPSRASMTIYVNGEKVDKIAMDKTSVTWNEWFQGTKRLNLAKGANVITYSMDADDIGNVNVDYLSMHKADVPYTAIEQNVKPQSIKITGTSKVIATGEEYQIEATALPASADQRIAYTSEDASVATVDGTGKVTGVSAGVTTITATSSVDNTVKATFRIGVSSNKAVPAKVTMNKDDVTLIVGEKATLSATVAPEAAENKEVTYASTKAGVATVDKNGVVTAVSPGTTVITATTSNGVVGFATVTVNAKATEKPIVTPAVKATKITLNKKKVTIKKGKKVTLKATVTPKGSSKVTWKTSNKKVATVTSKGVVKGVKKGKATITAKTSNGKKATCKVTVK